MIIHILRTVWLRYNNALQQRPFVTNTVSAGLIMTVGDSVSQVRWAPHSSTVQHNDTFQNGLLQHVLEGAPLSEHNWLRSAKLALWGFTMGGVPTVIWFRFLDRRWPNRVVSAVANAKVLSCNDACLIDTGHSTLVQTAAHTQPAVRHRNIVTKIVVNQCCASTVMNSLFLGWVIAFDRRNGNADGQWFDSTHRCESASSLPSSHHHHSWHVNLWIPTSHLTASVSEYCATKVGCKVTQRLSQDMGQLVVCLGPLSLPQLCIRARQVARCRPHNTTHRLGLLPVMGRPRQGKALAHLV